MISYYVDVFQQYSITFAARFHGERSSSLIRTNQAKTHGGTTSFGKRQKLLNRIEPIWLKHQMNWTKTRPKKPESTTISLSTVDSVEWHYTSIHFEFPLVSFGSPYNRQSPRVRRTPPLPPRRTKKIRRIYRIHPFIVYLLPYQQLSKSLNGISPNASNQTKMPLHMN